VGHPYFELRDVDRRFWAERIQPFLPDPIFDAHRHIAKPEHVIPVPSRGSSSQWAFEVAHYETLEQAQEGYSQLFTGRSVSCLAFGFPHQGCRVEENNAYVAQGLAGTDRAALVMTRPDWRPEKVLELLRLPRVIGIKPYQELIPGFARVRSSAPSQSGARRRVDEEVSVFDFCPHGHLAILNAVGGWLTLHLPRKERLADPRNLAEVQEIRRCYPRIVVVVAHIGRSYAGRYAREGLPPLCEDEGVLFDTSAVLNPAVFAVALDRVGPERLLFGSDFPILYMRGRRKWEGDRYINLTSGDYSWNRDREPPEVEATYTLYIYEAMAACIDACRQLGFGGPELRAIFHDNARRIVDRLLAEKANW
jgi:hypothetical protein